MKKLLIILCIINIIYAQHTDSNNQADSNNQDSNITESTTNITTTNTDESNDTKEQSTTNIDQANDTKEESRTNIDQAKDVKVESSIFDTAPVITHSYASFTIGYQMLFKKYNDTREHKEGIFFALDRGWNFIDDTLLFGLSLDGTAGGFYSININTKLSARFIDGRIIPSVSIGYGLLNHFIGDTQYNLHGANSTLALFVDITRGLGIEASYRIGLHPFNVTKKNSNIKVRNINAFMINLKFIDFSI